MIAPRVTGAAFCECEQCPGSGGVGQSDGVVARCRIYPTSATIHPMQTLLIVYHSMTGGTLQMAQAAAAGARAEPALRVSLLRAQDAQAMDLLKADGYLFATPENLAAMSGRMKEFFDRTYYPALDRLNGRPYATLICAGSDGRNAAQQIERIATGWRLKPVALSLIHI